jgi:uncharacterized protein (TIRG00374 family)
VSALGPEAATDDAAPTALRRRSVVLGLAIGVPISVVFGWLALSEADLDRVRASLADATIAPLLGAVALMGLIYILQAERWRRIAERPPQDRVRLLGFVVTAVACNNVLPGRVGDLFRARWLSVLARIPGGRALSTVVVDRSFDVLTLVALLLLSLPFVADETWLDRIVVGGLALIAVLFLVFASARIYVRQRPRERRTSRGLVRRVVRDTVEGLAVRMGPRRVGVAALLSVGAWSSWAVGAVLVGRSVGIDVTLLEALFVTGVMNLGVAILASPGYVGTYQWLAVASLGLFDVPREEALAFAILMQAVWYVPTTAAGAVMLGVGGVRRVRARSDRAPREVSESGLA